MYSKHFVIGLVLTFLVASVRSQNAGSFCDNNSYHVLQRLKGETIKVSCDTVYLLNKSTFNLLYSSYMNYKTQSDSLSNFFTSTDNFLYEYEKHVAEQKAEIDTMEDYFQSLSDSSKQLVLSTTSSLQGIDSSLKSIRLSVDSAQMKIEQAQVQIRKEERTKFLSHVWWGLGGLAIGVIIMAVAQ